MPRSRKPVPRPGSPPTPHPRRSRTRPVHVAEHGFAVGRDETRLFYQVEGPSDAPAVVCSDGIGCDGYVWKYLEPELRKSHRVLRWHYRGHGRTPAPRDRTRVGIPDLADDLAAVLDAATGTSTPAILAGHSMGVQVCLEAYRRHRDRVSGLVLLCGSYGTPLRTFKGQRTLEQVLPFVQFAVNRLPALSGALWRRLIPTELAFAIAKRFEINGELIRREDFLPYLEHMARVDLRLFLDMLAAAGRHSARELLEQIEVPTLIVAGDRDGFTPLALSREMHHRIRRSELLVVEGGSHTTPIERPAEVSSRVAAFIRMRT